MNLQLKIALISAITFAFSYWNFKNCSLRTPPVAVTFWFLLTLSSCLTALVFTFWAIIKL